MCVMEGDVHWIGFILAGQAALFLLGIPALVGWLVPWNIPSWLMTVYWVWCGIVGGVGSAYGLFMYSWKDSGF